MISFRQIFRCSSRLVFAKELKNLHQVPLIRRERLCSNLYDQIFIRTKTDLCELPQNDKEEGAKKKVLGKLEKKLKVMFTCKKCNYRNGKVISQLAYEKGVVIIRCNGCKNNHLIADNLGWFEELKNKRNIEKILAAKGETVRKVQNDIDGYIEIVAKAEFELVEHNKEREQRIIEEQNKVQDQSKKIKSSEES
ncbi:DNL-type zinc finger protein [Eufriesea mexicana]|uniref:DNL-type zinc finger protein n=1 Tax=Eufriesea mexicana TaxID=516756 RepID=A0A310SAZ4_9HYME|nr:PREDICTED: uncharacterized protein LOC108554280 [Eufriesea mexicana]OAD52074.1 DNL-type zinc finger protein [Eufriesea mexicana]